ncbi:hypothetical protein ACHHV8_18850 [Paenibacillus sp. TAB 01]|uniref:hypothetical protein n=1 Tax=Paenibacillus sp. TAB 01 TaxID=3368988 RepID=UPI0037525579
MWTVRQWKPLEQAFHQLLVEAEENTFFQLTRLSSLTYTVIAEFVNQAVLCPPARASVRMTAFCSCSR